MYVNAPHSLVRISWGIAFVLFPQAEYSVQSSYAFKKPVGLKTSASSTFMGLNEMNKMD